MNKKILMPKHKMDTETAEELFQYSTEELEPYLPELLFWFQDPSWPVARVMEKLVQQKLAVQSLEAIKRIIQQENDELWTYGCLRLLGFYPANLLYSLQSFLEEMAFQPGEYEYGWAGQELSAHILKTKFKEYTSFFSRDYSEFKEIVEQTLKQIISVDDDSKLTVTHELNIYRYEVVFMKSYFAITAICQPDFSLVVNIYYSEGFSQLSIPNLDIKLTNIEFVVPDMQQDRMAEHIVNKFRRFISDLFEDDLFIGEGNK